MRRVKCIPLAMAAVLAGTINLAADAGGDTDENKPTEERTVSTAPVAALQGGRSVGILPASTTTTAPPPTTAPSTTTTAPPPPPPPLPPPPPPPPPEPTGPAGMCPIGGSTEFIDSWGFARSGGRSHQGTDMMAEYGTPTVAPVSGRVEHRSSGLGGLSWYIYGDNGDMYYGTHLSGYENQGIGWVEAGTVIGYVGMSGNAQGTAPHLHFQYHPGGGSPVNPYPYFWEIC